MGLDDLAGEPPPEAQRSVRQRRNPPNHTDLASVLELIEDVDAAAHQGSWLQAHPPSIVVSGIKFNQGSQHSAKQRTHATILSIGPSKKAGSLKPPHLPQHCATACFDQVESPGCYREWTRSAFTCDLR